MWTVLIQLHRRDGAFGWRTIYGGPDQEEARNTYHRQLRNQRRQNIVIVNPNGIPAAWSPRPLTTELPS